MSYQGLEIFAAILLIFAAEGILMLWGGFENIKEAMQAAGGAIWNMITWPWRWHKQKKQIEQEWQQFMEERKGELAAQLMIMVQTEIFADQRERQQAGKDAVEEMEEQEGGKQWKENFMKRFMTKT